METAIQAEKVQGCAPTLSHQVTHKVFDAQSHSPPVAVPTTFRKVQMMQRRELANTLN